MEYLPNFTNPIARFDAAINIEIEILVSLIKLGYRKFAIKIKKGRWPTKKTQEMYYEKIQEKTNQKINLKILDGFLYESLHGIKFCIGPISTANIECLCNKIPVYIYEPLENGLNDYHFNSSKIFSKKTVSSNISQLVSNIKNETQSINAPEEYLFGGESFSNIKI